MRYHASQPHCYNQLPCSLLSPACIFIVRTVFLCRLSRSGKTIIFSIHQPRYSIFRQFDHLTLMNKGEIVYAGSADKAIGYFEELGIRQTI